EVNTVSTISSANAIELATKDLGYKAAFARPPEAELVVLPEAIKNDRDVAGASLTWKVELPIEDGTPATADHIYFINAHTGKIEFHYDNLQRTTGNSLYSGTVSLTTVFNGSAFEMRDPSRGGNLQYPAYPGMFTTD